MYKVVQIWPGLIVSKQVTVCPGHIWTTLYIVINNLISIVIHGTYYTRWFKYDRDKLWLVYTQIVPVILEPPCIILYYCLHIKTTCFDLSFGHLLVVSPTLEYSQLWGISLKLYNSIYMCTPIVLKLKSLKLEITYIYHLCYIYLGFYLLLAKTYFLIS
jgi:hypothetical protein